jgi:protein SCO1/2
MPEPVQNIFVRKRKLIIVLASFALFLIAGQYWYFMSTYHPPMPVYGAMPVFSLTAEDRRTVTPREFYGKVVIADFIFTTCAGPCPIMSGHMAEMQQDLADDRDIRLVSFTVDPEHDTPDVLAQYASLYGAKKDRWTFLTGDKHKILDMIRNDFHLAVSNDSNAIAHSTKFVLIDKHSNIRGYYDSDETDSMNKLLADAKRLAKER